MQTAATLIAILETNGTPTTVQMNKHVPKTVLLMVLNKANGLTHMESQLYQEEFHYNW